MAVPVSELSFVRRTHQLLSPRAARRWPPDRARPVAEALEPTIDGVVLLDTILAALPTFPFVSPLHTGTGLVALHVAALLGQGPSDVHERSPQGHVALFMCPHCVIGGCGVVSARLERGDRWTDWTEFGYGWPQLAGLGPFRFGTSQYDEAVGALATAEARTELPLSDVPTAQSSA